MTGNRRELPRSRLAGRRAGPVPHRGFEGPPCGRAHPLLELSRSGAPERLLGRDRPDEAGELGISALDVKVVPADTDRFGVGHGYNISPTAGTSAAIVSAAGKIRAKAQLLAGAALETSPENLTWLNGAWVGPDGTDPTQVKTVEELALYVSYPQTL